MNWLKTELQKLKRYDFLVNELAITPKEFLDENEILEMLALEAELLISNKTVIGYVNTQLDGIFTFNEALQKTDYYINQGKVFTYHPLNFLQMKYYVSYLKQSTKTL